MIVIVSCPAGRTRKTLQQGKLEDSERLKTGQPAYRQQSFWFGRRACMGVMMTERSGRAQMPKIWVSCTHACRTLSSTTFHRWRACASGAKHGMRMLNRGGCLHNSVSARCQHIYPVLHGHATHSKTQFIWQMFKWVFLQPRRHEL